MCVTPDQNAEAARWALEAGDYASAAGHIAAALAADPRSDGYIDQLRSLAASTGAERATRLFRDLSTAEGQACVAWLQAANGEADAALNSLAEASVAAPTSGYLQWLTTWARDEGWSPASATALTAVVDSLKPHRERLGALQMRAVARAVERRAARLTITPAPLALAAAEAWLCAGEPAKAAAWAGDAYESDHGYHSALVYGRALAGADRMASAERVFRVALTARPQDVPARLAWAIAAIEHDDGPGAEALFGEVLELSPSHQRAQAGRAYAQWLQQGTAARWLALHRAARRQSEDALVRAWDMRATPWRQRIEPWDMTAPDTLSVTGEPRWGLYEDGHPALPQPPASVLDLVLELAETEYASPLWLSAGREISLRAGLSATRDLMAVGLYREVGDEHFMAQRLAAMFCVIGMDRPAERRAALDSVFATNDVALRLAAVVALSELVQQEAPAAMRADVATWLAPLAKNAPWPLRRAAVYGLARLSPVDASGLVASLDAARG